MKRHEGAKQHENAERWLLTYADLMNNLLILFMMLYAMSVMDMQKFKKISDSFVETLLQKNPEIINATANPNSTSAELLIDLSSLLEPGGSTPGPESSLSPNDTSSISPQGTPGPSQGPAVSNSPGINGFGPGNGKSPEALSKEQYDALYSRINESLKEKGYEGLVGVEKDNDDIYVRFREGVFFMADSPELKKDAYPIIDAISDIIMDSYDLIAAIDISGHTARIAKNLPSKSNLFSWELSTDRALTVLRYLVQNCDVPQDKLSVTGYSSNHLYVEGEGEEFYAQNRRVEIRLTRKTNYVVSGD